MRKDLRAETRPRAVPRTASPRVRKRYPPFPVYDRPESSDCGKRRAEPGHYGGETEKIALQLKATLENVTNLRPVGEDFRWYLKMKCGNCGEISEKWQYIRLMDSVALKGGRGSASMVQKCKLCARENSIEILSSTIRSYNAEDNEKFKTIVEFECRGLEPVDFQPQAGFAAEGVESGTVFSDINLQEKDWTDYDEKARESVGIYEVAHQFVKC
ncbi:CXXC motif containing zinc binding protein isoform X1 [Sturnira hondurensis]|uniref:CXXC motif containing zinc binding protein isoform X1 n=1 Tax=Sturnira hondurensis TaxID=192404 RepID=UPI00187A58C2|nr:CXXC motif containing zinc binding protein isoform X1 [Sturnira hondurensis]